MRQLPRSVSRALATTLLTALACVAIVAGSSPTASADTDDAPRWIWPVDESRRIVELYRAPAHAYGAGHRGVDVAASAGTPVRAPADGIVAFRGVVVDRPLLTIEHAGGFVTTFEPLESALSPGDAVEAGETIGRVAIGGHAATGTLHVGVRLDGEYINPMRLFGEVPRAVLHPCCEPP